MKTSKYLITATQSCRRLDLWLHAQFPDCSRSMLQRLIRERCVRLHGETCVPGSPVKAGDAVEIDFPPPEPAGLQPESIPMDILFEDEHLLVLNKPAGVVVHPGAGHARHTLVHALLHHCKGELSGIGGKERPGIVHRLDKDTSGCLVVAKTDVTHRRLAELFQSRTVEKTYLAIVWGKPRMLSGMIEKPIGRHPSHRKKMHVSLKGRTAYTGWKMRECFGSITLLECRIHTGRTHQIRVHLASMGHPLVGDLVYGQAKDATLHRLAGRQMLHAWKLGFEHPVTGNSIHCKAPWPEDMKCLLEKAQHS